VNCFLDEPTYLRVRGAAFHRVRESRSVFLDGAVRAGWEKKAASLPQPRMAKPKKAPVLTTISVNLTVDIAIADSPALLFYRHSLIWPAKQPFFGESIPTAPTQVSGPSEPESGIELNSTD
jgi:hypothetical protein